MIKDQPKAVRTTRSRFQAMAAMEPELRNLYQNATPYAQASPSRRHASFGRNSIDFQDEGAEVRFWMTEKYTTIFRGVLDPVQPGKYCNGRVHVTTWLRGEWEGDLGAKVETFNPLTTGVLPTKLINQIRTGLGCWPNLCGRSEEAFKTVVACFGDPFDSMLQNALARHEASDAQLDVLMLTVPTAEFAIATALVLALNFARPTHVRRAWEIACKRAVDEGEDGEKIAQTIVGAKNSLSPILGYMTWPAPTDDEAELARDLFYRSFLGVVDPDGTRAGHIIDRMALVLKERGVSPDIGLSEV